MDVDGEEVGSELSFPLSDQGLASGIPDGVQGVNTGRVKTEKMGKLKAM
jgi:hypothetical protein